MNERRFDRMAEDFLADGPTVLADRVLDAAFDEVHLTRQRRVLWRAPWRFLNMSTLAKFAVAAVVVIAVGYLGLTFLRPAGTTVGGGPTAGPSATPTPAATTEPTPTPTPLPTAPPLTGQFTSDRHGFSITYPATWATRPATTPWTGGFVDFGEEDADLIYDPVLESDLFLAIASQPLGDRTPEEWLADAWQIVAEDDPGSADCASTSEPVTVDGTPGRICGSLALLTDRLIGRGYWVLAYTSGDQAWVDDVYDDAWFKSVLATMNLIPEGANDAP